MSNKQILSAIAIALVSASLPVSAHPVRIKCDMTYTLSGWAAFYKTAKGHGTVTCSDGQTMNVVLRSEGGGMSFGKSTIDEGYGEFTGVNTIHEVLGDYASGNAHAGVGNSAAATGLTKGEVSLSLTGKGRGVNLGVDFGKFTIARSD